MRGNQNLKVPLVTSNSPRNPFKLINPQDHIHSKTQLSPSNKSETLSIDRKSKRINDLLNTKPHSPHPKSVTQLLQKLNQSKAIEVSLRQEIKQIHKQNTQLTIANQSLRTQLFAREQQLARTREHESTIQLLEHQSIQSQKVILDLQSLIKVKEQQLRMQQEAKKKNTSMLSEMQFQNTQLCQFYEVEKRRCDQLTQKVMKYQDIERKNRGKIKELELKLEERRERESSVSNMSSSRITERENEKVRVLMNINERQKAEIVELYGVIEAKGKSQGSAPSKEVEALKRRVVEVESQLQITVKQNQQLKCLLSTKEQTPYSKQLEAEIAQLNEKVFNYNSQNNQLREELDEQYIKNRELQEVNVTLTNECRELDEKIIRYMKQVSVLAESVRGLESIKEEYYVLEEEKGRVETELRGVRGEVEEIKRKNSELLRYNEELRVEGERVKGEVIELGVEIEELRVSREKREWDTGISQCKRESNKVLRGLKERNIGLLSSFHRFKEVVLDELRVISLQLVVKQNHYKSQECQQVIIEIKRRLDHLLAQL